MASFNQHAALAHLQATHFKHSSNMYPADYGIHYRNLPVVLSDSTVKHVKVDSYKSTYTPERKKACNAFLSAARTFCDAPATRNAHALDWLNVHQARVVSCFAGQGLPEEISLICALAVDSGHKKVTGLSEWASSNFGMDCVGFVSSYLVALGTFEQMVAYIPSYKSIAGAATRIDDIKYDNVILWVPAECPSKAMQATRKRPAVRDAASPSTPARHRMGLVRRARQREGSRQIPRRGRHGVATHNPPPCSRGTDESGTPPEGSR